MNSGIDYLPSLILAWILVGWYFQYNDPDDKDDDDDTLGG